MQIQITLSSLSELEQLQDFLAGIKTPAVADNNGSEATEAKDDAKTEAEDDAKTEAEPTVSENEPISVRVRRVIQTTRERLGDDGSDATLRRGVNTELKNIALALGFDKPSAIDTEEAYESFKADANNLIVENGKVKTQLPF